MHPSMADDSPATVFAEDTPVMVKFPRTTEEERGDRADWPWLPGTILQQCGPDEWQVCVEDIAVAVRQDGSKPRRNTPSHKLLYPAVYRDASEIKQRDAR